MRKPFILLLLVSLGACAWPNRYAAENGDGGYADDKFDKEIRIARFAGNSSTSSKNADVLSHFRAVEVCLELGNLIARFWGTTDRSVSQTVRQSAAASYVSPSYFTNQTSGHSGIWGSSFGNDHFKNEPFSKTVFEYPTFDTAYSCSARAFSLGASFGQVPAEEMKRLVTDSPQGVRIESFNIGSQNQASLRVGDIVFKINGVRMLSVAQLGIAVDSAPNKERLELAILRAGRPLTVTVKALETTTEARSLNRVIINQACAISEANHRPLCSYLSR